MGDAQKAIKPQANEAGEEEKVQIPDTFDDSDIESEMLSDKLKKIDAYGDSGQGCSKEMENKVNKQVWLFENDQIQADLGKLYEGEQNEKLCEPTPQLSVGEDQALGRNPIRVFNSPEVFLPDDQIVNTQDNLVDEE